jgi:hypothetical protein
VTQAQVSGGAVRLHVVLTPVPLAPTTKTLAGVPTECLPVITKCTVDMTTDRRVHCRVRWCDPAKPVSKGIELPSACNYLIVASGK